MNRVYWQLCRKVSLALICLMLYLCFRWHCFNPKQDDDDDAAFRDNFPCNWFLLRNIYCCLTCFCLTLFRQPFHLSVDCCLHVQLVQHFCTEMDKCHNIHATHIIGMVENTTHSIKEDHTHTYATSTDGYRIVNDKNILKMTLYWIIWADICASNAQCLLTACYRIRRKLETIK